MIPKPQVCPNVEIDLNIIIVEFIREDIANKLQDLPVLNACTKHTAELCKLLGSRYGKFKLQTLTETYEY